MGRSRDDEVLIERLRRTLATEDPVPGSVMEAAKASLAWRSIDRELAELTLDSAMQRVSGVRSVGDETEPRLLTFQASELTVEIEVTPQGATRRLVGQLIPPNRAEVEIRWADGSTTGEADEIGLFAIGSVPAGPVSIVCRLPDPERHVVTSWVTV